MAGDITPGVIFEGGDIVTPATLNSFLGDATLKPLSVGQQHIKANAVSLDKLDESTRNRIVDYLRGVYKVGDIFVSSDETNPSEIFGGTWVRVKDSVIAAAGDKYAAGETLHIQANNIRTLIESSVDGTEWFNVYSDGFCEQGGEYAIDAGDGRRGWREIDLHKEMATTFISLVRIDATNESEACSIVWQTAKDITPASFKAYFSALVSKRIKWRAEGFLHTAPEVDGKFKIDILPQYVWRKTSDEDPA